MDKLEDYDFGWPLVHTADVVSLIVDCEMGLVLPFTKGKGQSVIKKLYGGHEIPETGRDISYWSVEPTDKLFKFDSSPFKFPDVGDYLRLLPGVSGDNHFMCLPVNYDWGAIVPNRAILVTNPAHRLQDIMFIALSEVVPYLSGQMIAGRSSAINVRDVTDEETLSLSEEQLVVVGISERVRIELSQLLTMLRFALKNLG